jgi:adenylate cyclase
MVTRIQSHVPADQVLDLTADEIQLQLDRILHSAEFKATGQQRAMLEFVVAETLAGREAEIKGYTVATQVFGRGDDFDQATDPIVSIQANKLRRALERYYLTAGRNDPVGISIPKGTYVPTFRQRNIAEQDREIVPETRSWSSFPSLLVRPFQNLTNDPELNYLGIGLATELAGEITRYQDIKVLLVNSEEGGRNQASDTGARFEVTGSFQKDFSRIKVVLHLVDLCNGLTIWSETHQSEFVPNLLIEFQEQVARVITAKLAGEFGILARFISIESKHTPVSQLTTYEAIMRYYEFNLNFTPDSFQRAFDALNHAVVREPDRGMMWSLLGRLYASNYSLELFNLDTPLEDALAFAKRGAKLEPYNQRIRAILAYILLISGNLEAGVLEVERGIALNPGALIFMDGFGYLLTLLGDWRRGPAMIREAIQQNPYYSTIAHYALWVDWIRQEDYQQAYLETLHFTNPSLFWDPLTEAATFGLLGRFEEGRQAAKNLLMLKPDFPSRGRTLIEYYIKFNEIVERTIEGLNKVGIRLQ